MNEELKKLIEQINTKAPKFAGSIRAVTPEGAKADDEKKFELSFSSEDPYERWFGMEILGHKKGEVRMDWIASGNAPFLLQHNHDQLIGVIESAKISGGRGTAVVRFGKGALAQEIKNDVEDGIRRNVSVGYRVHEMKLIKGKDNAPDEYRVTDWEPYEVSLVSMPADRTVGTNRADKTVAPEITPKQEKNNMTPEDLKKEAIRLGLSPDASLESVLRAQAAQSEQSGRAAADGDHRAEIARRDAISTAAEMHNLKADGEKFIREGKSAADFSQFVMDKYAKGHTPVAQTPVLSRSEHKDLSKFSLLKAVREFGENKLTGLEAEMHQQGLKDARDIGASVSGLSLPGMILNLRANEFTVATEGADMVATDLQSASFIDILRAKLLLQKLGARFLSGMVGNFTLPKLTAGSSVTWGTEIEAATQQLPTTGQVAFTPNRFNAYIDISKQMLVQGSPDAEMLLRMDLMTAAAVGIETAAINGAGGSEPTGILNTSGIGSVAGGTNGAKPTDSHIIDLETAVATANGDLGSLAYLTTPGIRGLLKKTAIESGAPDKVWDRRTPEAPLNGYRAEATTLVPSTLDKGEADGTCSAIIFGNFSDLVVAQWGGLDLLVDPYTLAKTNLTSLILNGYADVGIRQAGSFAAMKDALLV